MCVELILIIIVIILVLCICKPANEYFTNNDSLQGGASGSDGLTSGFANNQKNQITMLRYKFDNWIQPTLTQFIADYQYKIPLQHKYRLKRYDSRLDASERAKVIQFLTRVANFKSENIKENYKPQSGETSYTSNKEHIYMCVRNKQDRVHNDDIVLFAFIHELSHVGCISTGHDDEFWIYFRLLLQILCQYEYPGQKEKPTIRYCTVNLASNIYNNYCNSFNVKYNPLFDNDAYMR